jgi:hypothetical protein
MSGPYIMLYVYSLVELVRCPILSVKDRHKTLCVFKVIWIYFDAHVTMTQNITGTEDTALSSTIRLSAECKSELLKIAGAETAKDGKYRNMSDVIELLLSVFNEHQRSDLKK